MSSSSCWGVRADLVAFLRVPHFALKVVCKQGFGPLQHPAQLVAPNKAVKVHGQLVVIQAVLDNVVSVLQQDGKAQEQHERIAFAELLRRWEGTRFDAGGFGLR